MNKNLTLVALLFAAFSSAKANIKSEVEGLVCSSVAISSFDSWWEELEPSLPSNAVIFFRFFISEEKTNQPSAPYDLAVMVCNSDSGRFAIYTESQRYRPAAKLGEKRFRHSLDRRRVYWELGQLSTMVEFERLNLGLSELMNSSTFGVYDLGLLIIKSDDDFRGIKVLGGIKGVDNVELEEKGIDRDAIMKIYELTDDYTRTTRTTFGALGAGTEM
jgi:hypothetical protein